jgi:hypothetical protein
LPTLALGASASSRALLRTVLTVTFDLILDGISGDALWKGLILSGVGDLPNKEAPTLKSVKAESGPILCFIFY